MQILVLYTTSGNFCSLLLRNYNVNHKHISHHPIQDPKYRQSAEVTTDLQIYASESSQGRLHDLCRIKLLICSVQDGKPYIISVTAGQATEDSRAQGYTVAVVTTFASEEDFHYYDTQCSAHAELKSFAKTVNQGMVMVYYHAAS